MNRCIYLASKGAGKVAPNPMVGCVIVHNGEITGEGFHRKFGEAHAEINAIASVGDKTTLRNSTLYVTLEPCTHYGKTPPCTDALIKHKIPRIIIAASDNFEKVSGKGIDTLRAAGADVITGILEKEYRWLNRRYFYSVSEKRPYVILKWAQTKDGFIGRKNEIVKISNKKTSALSHKWRAEEQAIMIGTETAINDNPLLTTRLWHGKNPVRVVIDRTGRIPETLNIFNNDSQTIVFTETKRSNRDNVEFVSTEFNRNFPGNMLNAMYTRGIQSVIVEGGVYTIQSFINAGLWNEARVVEGNSELKSGIKAPSLNIEPVSQVNTGGDLLKIYINQEIPDQSVIE